jgi:nucleotide-binding universal stress UspA family protein
LRYLFEKKRKAQYKQPSDAARVIIHMRHMLGTFGQNASVELSGPRRVQCGLQKVEGPGKGNTLRDIGRWSMKILLATDGSEHSVGAAQFLARFDLSALDRVTVLHVVPDIPFRHAGESQFAALMEIGEEIAPGIVDATAGYLKDQRANISTAVTTGHPAEAILAVAMQANSDLIVMGSRGMKTMGSLLLGSVTRAVAINSPHPVLVVKPPQGGQEGPLRVLFATDGSDCARETEKLLVSVPFPEDTAMTAVYVSPSTYMEVPDRFYLEMDERVKKITANMKEREMKYAGEVLEQARTALKDRFRHIATLMKCGDPSEQILRAARETGTNVIALGSRGMRGVRGMLGSVARNVLGHADCSVLICKGRVAAA